MPDINDVIKKADSLVPPLPILRLRPVAGKGGIFDSKLGGTPYFPKSMEYPRGTDGSYKDKPLRLLVQLNFEKLPHIEDFPRQGILQIFLACENDCLYGFDFNSADEQTNQNGFRVIYHKDIITDTSLLISDDDIPCDSFSSDEYDFPLKKEFILCAEEPDKCPATPDDYRFGNALVSSYSEIMGQEVSNYWNIDGYDTLYDRCPESVAFIGGYPRFTQSGRTARLWKALTVFFSSLAACRVKRSPHGAVMTLTSYGEMWAQACSSFPQKSSGLATSRKWSIIMTAADILDLFIFKSYNICMIL